MKKLITLGLLVATVAFGGTAFAGTDDSGIQDIEVQKLIDWSAQVAKPAASLPAYQQYPFGIR